MYELNIDVPFDRYLVFTDMDGTLLDHHSYSFDSAIPTLEALNNKNAIVIPNTSKTFAEMLDLREAIGLTGPFIVENGAAIYIPENFDINLSDQGFRFSDGYYVKSFARPRKVFIKLLEKIDNRFSELYQPFSKMTLEDVATATDLPLTAAAKAQQRQYGEPIKWLGNESQKRIFIEELKTLGGHVVEGGRFIHFADKTDKAQAMIFFKQLIQTQTNDTFASVALGDGNNDLMMLEKADISICIKSPVNPPLVLNKQHNVFYTKLEGPKGWAESIQALIIKPTGLI